MKAYLLLGSLIILWLSLAIIAIKYDYKSQPDKPGVNCIDIDSISGPILTETLKKH